MKTTLNTGPFQLLLYLFYTLRAFLALLVILTLIIIITPIVFLVTVLFDKERKIYLIFTRFFIHVFLLLNFKNAKKHIHLNQAGQPNADEKKIYVINHSSLFDGLLFFLLPGHIKFLAKDFYAKIPIFGLGMSMTGNVAVKKGSQGEQVDIYYQAAELIDAQYPLVIFPEGHRSRDSKIGRFQNGAFMLALEKKTAIVPVVFDTWNVLRPGSFMVRDTHFSVHVLETLPYEKIQALDYKQISNLVKYQIMDKYLAIIAENKSRRKNYYRKTPYFEKIDREMQKELLELKEKIVPIIDESQRAINRIDRQDL